MRHFSWFPRLFCYARALLFAAGVLSSNSAWAFPPYRSTDADTAATGTLELRAGLVKLQQNESSTDWATPLMRLNVGLSDNVEISSELEYVPRDHRLGDAAVGGKWVPIRGVISVGIEALALLPVQEHHGGLGFEGQFLATLRREQIIVHLNGGGFHDPRAGSTETGWRSSLLIEFPMATVRPGLEVFAKQTDRGQIDGRLGAGLIVALGRFDVRTGLHAGITREAPNLTFSLWIGTSFGLR